MWTSILSDTLRHPQCRSWWLAGVGWGHPHGAENDDLAFGIFWGVKRWGGVTKRRVGAFIFWWQQKLRLVGGVNSNMFVYFHPENWVRFTGFDWFLRCVEATNQKNHWDFFHSLRVPNGPSNGLGWVWTCVFFFFRRGVVWSSKRRHLWGVRILRVICFQKGKRKMKQVSKKSLSQSRNQSISESVNQSNIQSMNQSVNKSTNHLVN